MVGCLADGQWDGEGAVWSIQTTAWRHGQGHGEDKDSHFRGGGVINKCMSLCSSSVVARDESELMLMHQ